LVLRDIRARMIVVEEVSDRDGRGFNVVLFSTVQDSVFAGSSCSVYRDDLVSCSEESEILSRRTTGTMLASNVVLRLGQPLSTPMSHFASAFLIRFRRESQRELRFGKDALFALDLSVDCDHRPMAALACMTK